MLVVDSCLKILSRYGSYYEKRVFVVYDKVKLNPACLATEPSM